MKRPGSIFLVVLLVALTWSFANAPAQGLAFLEEIGSDIDISGLEKDWDPETKVALVSGDVRIACEGVVIKAKRAEFHTSTREIKASGDVAVFKQGKMFRGEAIIYNMRTGLLTSDGLRSRSGDLVFYIENFRTNSGETELISGEQAMLTTHDHVTPNFRIEPQLLEIYLDDRVVMKNPKFIVGDVPVFWLPRFTQPLDSELGYLLTPGYNSRWGTFLINRYGMLHGEHTLAQYHLDLRSGRGVGLGVDFFSEKFRDVPGVGQFKLYYSKDSDPEFDRQSRERSELSENRYRINFQHRIYFPGPEKSTLYLDFDVNKVSDRLYYEDFFFEDARVDPSPENLVNLVSRGDRYEASLLTRFQLNDFSTQDTRLPEIALDFTTQQLWNSPLFYRGSSSWGILDQKLSDQDEDEVVARRDALQDQLRILEQGGGGGIDDVSGVRDEIDRLQALVDGVGYHRLFTYHELLYPTTLGPLTFVPRVGGGLLYYSDIENASEEDSLDRGIFHVGFDLSTKWTREFDVQMPNLGIDGLRHVVQPYVNYSFVDAGGNSRGRLNVRIDGNIPTTKLRPIDVPLFSNVDAIGSWNIVRVGIRHVLQTRRDEPTLIGNKRTHTWLLLDTFVDSFIEDPERDRDLSGLYTSIDWRPVPWISLAVDSLFPIESNPQNLSELNTKLSWMPNDRLQLGVRHLLLQGDPVLDDSSLYSLDSFFRLSENWGFSSRHRFEAEDGELESQAYSIHRDLTTWTAALGFEQVINEDAEDEVGVVLSFTLKDFPMVNFPFDFNPNPASE